MSLFNKLFSRSRADSLRSSALPHGVESGGRFRSALRLTICPPKWPGCEVLVQHTTKLIIEVGKGSACPNLIKVPERGRFSCAELYTIRTGHTLLYAEICFGRLHNSSHIHTVKGI